MNTAGTRIKHLTPLSFLFILMLIALYFFNVQIAYAAEIDTAQVTLQATIISVSGTTESTPDALSFDATPQALSHGDVTASAPTEISPGSNGLILTDCSQSTLTTSSGEKIPYTLDYNTAGGTTPLDLSHCSSETYIPPESHSGTLKLITQETSQPIAPNQNATGTTVIDISAP